METTIYRNQQCKVCGSNQIIKIGRIKGVQRWKCRTCGRKFLDNDALFGMKTPSIQVVSAIRMYFGGKSLNYICQQLQKKYNAYPSDSTVYGWINSSTKSLLKETVNYQPEVGTTWVAVRTVLKIKGKQIDIWDIADTNTGFLLTTYLPLKPGRKDNRVLLEKAIEKAGKLPKVFITNSLSAPVIDLKADIGEDIEFKENNGLIIDDKSNVEMKRFQDIFQRRTDQMSKLKSLDGVKNFLCGWSIYYNYYRTQKSLGNKTPAEMANIKYPAWRVGNLEKVG